MRSELRAQSPDSPPQCFLLTHRAQYTHNAFSSFTRFDIRGEAVNKQKDMDVRFHRGKLVENITGGKTNKNG
jgi:hypothetical protein